MPPLRQIVNTACQGSVYDCRGVELDDFSANKSPAGGVNSSLPIARTVLGVSESVLDWLVSMAPCLRVAAAVTEKLPLPAALFKLKKPNLDRSEVRRPRSTSSGTGSTRLDCFPGGWEGAPWHPLPPVLLV